MGVWVKILCFWPYSTIISRKNLLLDVCSPSNETILDAELDSTSNGSSFKLSVSGKYGVWVKILCFWPYSASMSRKNLLLNLYLPSNSVFLDAELNSASNDSSFKLSVSGKYGGLGQNTVFLALFYQYF